MKTKNYVDGMLSFICMYEFIFHIIDISSYLKRLFRLMIFYDENQQQYSICGIGSMPHELLINAELSFCVLIKGLTNLKFFQNMPHSRATLYLIYIGQPSPSDV